MKYFFPIHLDGGNRGCEGIAKGSAILLDQQPEHMLAYCRDVELDTRLGIANYLTLMPCQRESMFIDKLLGAVNRIFHTSQTAKWRQLYPYKSLLRLVEPDDVVLFTGGDMMCYDNNEVIYINNWLHRQGVKSILWGCSMGPENQTKEKLETLFNFSLIYARESLTYDYFKSLGLKQVCLFPDPAFILDPQPYDVPAYLMNNEVVGLNISNYVMGGMSLDGNFAKEVLHLIRHILNDTAYHILLVPHVTWNQPGLNQDDREMACIIRDYFGSPERLHVLDISSLNYCQIRYAISKCRMFVGARTHAVISAYSMCVPSIALGYSIKSRGIARDLGLEERLVVDSRNCPQNGLVSSFDYLMEHENSLREHLREVMPEYKQRTFRIREAISSTIKL